MLAIRSVAVSALLLQLGCGGISKQSGPALEQGSLGGSAAASAGSSGAGANPSLGGAPNLVVPPYDAGALEPDQVPEGTSCDFPRPSCTERGQQIQIHWLEAGDAEYLSYPIDTSCGACVTECKGEDCGFETTCALWAHGTRVCSDVDIRLAACGAASGQGACLNTASSPPYYIDGSGKRWNELLLRGSVDQLGSGEVDGPVALDLSLTVSDGVRTKTASVHATLCASISFSGVICK